MPAFQNQATPQAVANSNKDVWNRILVVDDDRRMASRIAQWLCSLGWHATAAGDVTDAIKKIGRHRYDFCILDGELPDNGSIRLATLLRSVWEEAPPDCFWNNNCAGNYFCTSRRYYSHCTD